VMAHRRHRRHDEALHKLVHSRAPGFPREIPNVVLSFPTGTMSEGDPNA